MFLLFAPDEGLLSTKMPCDTQIARNNTLFDIHYGTLAAPRLRALWFSGL